MDPTENVALQQNLALLRHLLSMAAGAIVAQGVLTNDQATSLVGAIVTIFPIAWSLIEKVRVKKVIGLARAETPPEA